MAKILEIDWNQLGKVIPGLETKVEHDIHVRREAIPIIFVPGIMGSHLRRPGTNGEGEDKVNSLPNLRWKPSGNWAIHNLVGADGEHRRRLLVGEPEQNFDPAFLEVDNDTPPGDGFRGIMPAYHKFLHPLREHNWEELGKFFELPVYAFGYNWTDDVRNSGDQLAKRIDEIILEAREITGLCEKVILISHSMGGLVCRAASELSNAKDKIVGIIHGVQPVNGAPAAYWRIKAGFEGFDWSTLGLLQSALGNDGKKVTAVLGNIPGGLQMLPNKQHKAHDDGQQEWLTITQNGNRIKALPERTPADPYDEIYRVKAIVRPQKGETPSTNEYWGLVDPDLLNPAILDSPEGDELDAVRAENKDPWNAYLACLAMAEALHDDLSPPSGPKQHERTLCLSGTGHKTADVIELRIETEFFRWEPYPDKCFRGFFRNADGDSMQAVLQDPVGEGDSTVVLSSAIALEAEGRPEPHDLRIKVEHQPAFENKKNVHKWAFDAVRALCKFRFYEQRAAAKPSEGK